MRLRFLFSVLGGAQKSFLFVVLDDEVFDGSGHGRVGFTYFTVNAQVVLFEQFDRGLTSGDDAYFALLEIREVLYQGSHASGREESEEVVVELFVGSEVVADRSVHNGVGVVDVGGIKEFSVLLDVDIGRDEEELLVSVFLANGGQVNQLSSGGVEDLALAILNIV